MRRLAGKILSKAWLFFILKVKVSALEKSDAILSVFFHRPNAAEFEKWVIWCKARGFKFISTADLQEINAKKQSDNGKLIWLTFDDGWRNNYTEIFPILKKHSVPATIFVSTGLIDEGIFWLELARLNKNILPMLPNELKLVTEQERRNIMNDLKGHPEFVTMEREFMTWEELNFIDSTNLISIANHTHNHIICTKCSTEELQEEIGKSEALLNKYCPQHINAFAYPNGNYNDNTQELLKSKFKLIALVDYKNITKDSDLQYLTRICLSDRMSTEENIFNMLGFRRSLLSTIKRSSYSI